MEEKTGGKRLTASSDKREGKTKNVPVIVAGAVCAALVVGYLVLCAAVGGDKLWPHTSVMDIDVSGLTPAQAEEKVTREMPEQWSGRTLSFIRLVDNNTAKETVATLDVAGLMEPDDVTGPILTDQKGSFLARGTRYLTRLLGGEGRYYPSLQFTAEGEQRVDDIIHSISRALGVSGNETTWTVDDAAITFTKGYTATRVNSEALWGGVAMALQGVGLSDEIDVAVVEAPPAAPNFEAIRNQLHVEAADAYLDRESGEVVESVIGKDLDVEAARIALAATAEGKTCRVPLDLTEPALSTEILNGLLFRDILGQATTKVTGTSDRIMNVGVAAAFVNETVVFPGEEFSFNQTCSPYAESNGYGKATAYVNGLSKDTVAGGICQASSTLYWATLKANLRTVERNAHRYEPSYIKGGLDATVYGDYGESGGLDFRFINNTQHPIKLEGYMDANRYLHMTIKGTDTTGIHGEPYSTNRVVTQAYQTVYEADASVPRGIIKKDAERTGYTAVNIDTYQKLVDASGNTVSENKLYTSKYKVRNEVLLYNPVDAETWGIDPVTGIRTQPVIVPVESEIVVGPGNLEDPAGGQDPAVPPTQEPNESAAPPESGDEPVLPPAAQTPAPAVSAQRAEPSAEPDPPATEPEPVPTGTDAEAPLPTGSLNTGE